MPYRTGVKSHDDAIALAEGQRQVGIASASSQAQARSTDIQFFRSLTASSRTNNNNSGIEQSLTALRELGVGQ
jgi:hypothetical protein